MAKRVQVSMTTHGLLHPGGNPGANLKSISHRCYLCEVASGRELTEETIVWPLGCLQSGTRATHNTVGKWRAWPAPRPPFDRFNAHVTVLGCLCLRLLRTTPHEASYWCPGRGTPNPPTARMLDSEIVVLMDGSIYLFYLFSSLLLSSLELSGTNVYEP